MKKSLKLLLVTSMCLVAALLSGVFLWPILSYHPVNKIIAEETGQWGTRVELIPRVFTTNTSILDAKETLLKAGFRLENIQTIWQKYKFEIELGRNVYNRRTSNWACNIDMYVFIEFYENNHVIFAEGTQHEAGCL